VLSFLTVNARLAGEPIAVPPVAERDSGWSDQQLLSVVSSSLPVLMRGAYVVLGDLHLPATPCGAQ
jgi:hypothetical protein